MKLLSHGEQSNLLEHLAEVMSAATCLEERIIFACHDIGKATTPWQQYISNSMGRGSPHPHAAVGGILSALILRELNDNDALAWSLTALHVGAAHHSALQEIRDDPLKNAYLIVSDKQAKNFFLDEQEGIASLLPECPHELLLRSWDQLTTLATNVRARNEWNGQLATLSAESRLTIALRARQCLGRLCLFDHFSAAKQSGNATSIPTLNEALDTHPFTSRKKRIYPESAQTIHRLRVQLKNAFLQVIDADHLFYFIDAPTGLGKTETMLSAAEKILTQQSLHHIVFAVPQVSIADQIFEEYFQNEANAQIWNYRRIESTQSTFADHDKYTDADAVQREQHPFSHPYNVTTFNQVLLAMCHPDRLRCIRGLGLRDAVIIMDEFHKLPLSILPFFFRFAQEFSRQTNCRFIVGSATPLTQLDYFDITDYPRLDQQTTNAIYLNPRINSRRHYRSIGKRNIEQIIEQIEQIHSSTHDNLLVVVNLVAKGTWPLQHHFRGNWNPWQQLDALDNQSTERLILCLDGLMPPYLRRELVIKCKKAMKIRPVTLITTQMIEVGVDLDFDRALIDYQGIAATIQRGGRVGREGRDTPCDVAVFSLITDNEGTTSFDRLNQGEQKNSLRLKINPFKQIQETVNRFRAKEERFFDKWRDIKNDATLSDQLANIQRQIFGAEKFGDKMSTLLDIHSLGGSLGATLENTQFIAELFDEDHQQEIIILKDANAYETLEQLSRLIASNTSTQKERRAYFKILSDHKISINSSILTELNIGTPNAILPHPDESISVYQFQTTIL
ncbi:MAG: DEAD/DEAH box helicase family protein [Akkermansia sp.]